ncbi:1-pyrroline-5-carboxylate dehydrogenase [Diatrype stigma]|uniref:Multifunctional fusion protein n=1 Tax=Diatrype stigma TaxID=117547 RepID=A0AAN9UPK2_9PEZI
MAASRKSCGGLAIACRSGLQVASRGYARRVPSQLVATRSLTTTSPRLTTLASFKTPRVFNEPNQHYEKGSPQRAGLYSAVEGLKKKGPIDIPIVVGGKEITTPKKGRQHNPSDHASTVANYSLASTADVNKAIEAALAAKPAWEAMPFADRAAVFLKAADLISTKYRYEIMAVTMLGQGKNAWQAEIDAAAELCDFFRFNVAYAEELYAQQPSFHAPGVWNRVEYRPLEGFVYAVSPFNFTAIGGNLAGAPALLGNVVLWKPSDSAVASAHLVYRILREAGLPENVIQFVPGDAEEVTRAALGHRQFAALHYTGSTAVFRSLYGQVGAGVAEGRYAGYPRVVGETGGKNFHLVHRSADLANAAVQTVRGAFEYQGQKCSATSRAYVPASAWPEFKDKLIAETKSLVVGPPTDPANFVGPVIHAGSFNKLARVIDDAKNDPDLELLAGGAYDDSKGYFVQPTIYRAKTATHPLLSTELFGPILTVHVYDDAASAGVVDPAQDKAFADACALVDGASEYGLTGSVFAADRRAVRVAEERLRNAAGNFYVNCKSTGAVVGQQPFGGGRASGTNDKAGSINLLGRFVSVRSIKEEFGATTKVPYPSNEV